MRTYKTFSWWTPSYMQALTPNTEASEAELRRMPGAATREIVINTSSVAHHVLRLPSPEELAHIVAECESQAVAIVWNDVVSRCGTTGLMDLVDMGWLANLLKPGCSAPHARPPSDAARSAVQTFLNWSADDQRRFLEQRRPDCMRHLGPAVRGGSVTRDYPNLGPLTCLSPTETQMEPRKWLGCFTALLFFSRTNNPEFGAHLFPSSKVYVLIVAARLVHERILVLPRRAIILFESVLRRTGVPKDSELYELLRAAVGRLVDPYIAATNAAAGVIIAKVQRRVGVASTRWRCEEMAFCTSLGAIDNVSWDFAVSLFHMPRGDIKRPVSKAVTVMLREAALRNCGGRVVEHEDQFVPRLERLCGDRRSEMQAWLDAAGIFHRSAPATKFIGRRLNGMVTLFNWQLSQPKITPPTEIRRSHIRNDDDPNAPTFRRAVAGAVNEAKGKPILTKQKNKKFLAAWEFFASVAEKNPGFLNPIEQRADKFIDRRGTAPLIGATPRQRIDDWVLDDLRNFLVVRTEAGYDWSDWAKKSLIVVRNQEVFCPIYPAAIALLLRWSLRSNQILMLDGGELDALRYDFDGRKFVPNPNGIPDRAMGVLSPAVDDDTMSGAHHLDFLVALNKRPLGEPQEYTIPFMDEETAWIVQNVLEWQKVHGAPPALVKETGSPYAVNRGLSQKDDAVEQQPDICCLFRDPREGGLYPPDPAKIAVYWDRVCAAYDASNSKWVNPRTGEVGERPRWPKLSKPRTRFSPSEQKRPLSPSKAAPISRYDVHSLRVGGVSYLLDKGVPLAMVAAVAGHASLLMTLHYYKADRSKMRLKFSEVFKNRPDLRAIANHVEAQLKSVKSYDEWLRAASPQAFTALKEAYDTRGNYQIWHRGICPGTRCEDGLQIRNLDKGTLVPGALCGLCRFFIYGPTFLPGLVKEFNETLCRLERTARQRARIVAKVLSLEGQGEIDESFVLRNEVTLLHRRSEPECAHLVRLHEIIHECLAMAEHDRGARPTGASHVLVNMAGKVPVRAQIDPVGQFDQFKEILTMSRILPAQHSAVAEHVEADFTLAMLTVLDRNGIQPYLLGLPTEIKQRALLEFAEMFQHAIPESTTREDVFQGRRLLQDIDPTACFAILDGVRKHAAVLQGVSYSQLGPSSIDAHAN